MPFLALVLVLASSAPVVPPRTLLGVTLDAPLPIAISQSGKRTPVEAGAGVTSSVWVWKRPEGGTLTVTTDARDKVLKIDFVVGKGENDSIDLPCAPEFPTESSHVNLSFAVDPKVCVETGNDIGTYRLPDGSVFHAIFGGPGDTGIVEAVWYRP